MSAAPYRVTLHALQRYGELHPGASQEEVMADLAQGVEIEPALFNHLAGRGRREGQTDDRYVLTNDRRGVFVLCGGNIVTCLRLGLAQIAYALRTWPLSQPPPKQRAVSGKQELAQWLSARGLPAPTYEACELGTLHRVRVLWSGESWGEGLALKLRQAEHLAADAALRLLQQRLPALPSVGNPNGLVHPVLQVPLGQVRISDRLSLLCGGMRPARRLLMTAATLDTPAPPPAAALVRLGLDPPVIVAFWPAGERGKVEWWAVLQEELDDHARGLVCGTRACKGCQSLYHRRSRGELAAALRDLAAAPDAGELLRLAADVEGYCSGCGAQQIPGQGPCAVRGL